MNSKVILKKLKKKKSITEKDINHLTSLPKEEMEQVTQNLSIVQKERILELLCTPKAPDWIENTVKLHFSTPSLKYSLPEVKGKKDFKSIVKMIMISAGDTMNPNKETVSLIHDHVHEFLIDHSLLSKKALSKKFKSVLTKYRSAHKITSVLNDVDEFGESEEEAEESKDMRSVEKLQFNDLRTKDMSEKDYLKFSECRKASFLKQGQERFLKWIKGKKFPKVFSWIGRERIIDIVEKANRSRSEDGKLTVLQTPLLPGEIMFN